MPSLACCTGFIDSGIPKGTIEKIAGIECYISKPKDQSSKKHVLIVCTDVFGWRVPNVRLIADGFTESTGFTCVVPDMFNGSEMPAELMDNMQNLTTNPRKVGVFQKLTSVATLTWNFSRFIWSNGMGHKNMLTIIEVIKALQKEWNVESFGIQGYCWGGKLAVLLAQGSNGPAKEDLPIHAICSNHPGGLSIPSDIDKISPKTSACFICPEIDMEIKEKQRELIKSSLEKIRQSDPRFQYLVKYYDGVEHGFSVRGNENDPVIAAKRQDAHKTNANFLSNLG